MTTPSPSPRGSLTGRAAILAVALLAVVLSLALPLREFVQQRSRIADLSDRAAASSASIEQLTVEQRRWEDPAYVAAQARERLHLVMPGEVAYVVLEPDPAADTNRTTGPASGGAPWYDRLWQSVNRPSLQSTPVVSAPKTPPVPAPKTP